MNQPGETTRDVTVVNAFGLHARTAAKIAEIAQKARSRVWIVKDNETVDASSIIDILTLAATRGSTIRVGVDDLADAEILNRIVLQIESGFGET
jgi:phosphocarrier protein HPr